jgi:hypothetical protein
MILLQQCHTPAGCGSVSRYPTYGVLALPLPDPVALLRTFDEWQSVGRARFIYHKEHLH